MSRRKKEDQEASIMRITVLVCLLICTAAFGGYLVGASRTVDKIVYNHKTGEQNINYVR